MFDKKFDSVFGNGILDLANSVFEKLKMNIGMLSIGGLAWKYSKQHIWKLCIMDWIAENFAMKLKLLEDVLSESKSPDLHGIWVKYKIRIWQWYLANDKVKFSMKFK